MRTEHEEFVDEMTALNHQREAPKTPSKASVLEPTTAKYLLDFLYLTRDDEQFRFYKKVSQVADIYLKFFRYVYGRVIDHNESTHDRKSSQITPSRKWDRGSQIIARSGRREFS